MSEEPTGPSPETTLRYRGELVRLAAIEPETDAEAFAAFLDEPMATRLAGFRPAWPMNRASAQHKLEEWAKAAPREIHFAARTIADDRLVGGIGLMDINHADGNAQLGPVGLRPRRLGPGLRARDGARAALRVRRAQPAPRLAHDERLQRARAEAVREKLGFRHEGRGREHHLLDGKRWDLVSMGILRDEFER
jgi:RimJ/RimL family protein N-acetyltransferase